MKISFNFTACCGVRFAKIYRQLMRDIRKQYGKKKVSEFTIIASETPRQIVVHNKGFIRNRYRSHKVAYKTEYYCRSCGKLHVNKGSFIGSDYNITIEG